jgi:uncharacterized damage-inducible protein DinB
MRTSLLLLAVATPLVAQQQQAADPSRVAVAAARANWITAHNYIVRAAEQMSEADFAFKPVATVRSFGQIVAHVAGANYIFCAAARGEKAPYSEDHFEKTASTKAAIAKALADSIAYCDAAYKALDDRRAAESVAAPFGSGKSARASALIGNTGHLQEHYGNLVTYLRINGIVPPSSSGQ